MSVIVKVSHKSKMLPVLLILLPTAILASNYGNYGSFQNPMRYHGDHNSNHQTKPEGNLVFNFEQLRRDQPPQIEMRDESLGFYMHRRPQTTAAPIVVPEFKHPEFKPFENNDPFSRFSNMPAHGNNDYNRQSTPTYSYHTNVVQSTPVYQPHYTHTDPSTPMPSPPPAPQWSDFSETFNKQVFPHYGFQEPSVPKVPTAPEFNHFQGSQHQSAGPVMPHHQNIPAAPTFNNFQGHQQNVPERRNPVNHDFRRSPAPTSSYSSTTQQSVASRGNHKFSWNDLVTEPSWAQTSHQVSSTSAPVVQGNNPPSVPTLTPWLDGFGK